MPCPNRSGTKSTDQRTTRPARPSRRWTRPRAQASGLNPNQASTRGRRERHERVDGERGRRTERHRACAARDRLAVPPVDDDVLGPLLGCERVRDLDDLDAAADEPVPERLRGPVGEPVRDDRDPRHSLVGASSGARDERRLLRRPFRPRRGEVERELPAACAGSIRRSRDERPRGTRTTVETRVRPSRSKVTSPSRAADLERPRLALRHRVDAEAARPGRAATRARACRSGP